MISHSPSRCRSVLVAATIFALLGHDLRPALASERPSAIRNLWRVGTRVGKRLVAPLGRQVARMRNARRIRLAKKPAVIKPRVPSLWRRPLAAVLAIALVGMLTIGSRCNGRGEQVKKVDPASYFFAERATNEAFQTTGEGEYAAPDPEFMLQHARFSKLIKHLVDNPATHDPPPELDSPQKVRDYLRVNFGYPDFPSTAHASAALDMLSLAPTAPGRELPIQAAIRRVGTFAENKGPIRIFPGFGEAPIEIEATLPIPKGAVPVAKKMGLRVVGHPDGILQSNGIVYLEMSMPPQPPPGPPNWPI